ncbi:sulfite exporter TauE/SafE family protein [Pseudoalteromonas fenneropenaei]|uniref:Sulfite exporter TauE/SafE family protein n=1 Tax=Pseudoalteromonas fenneropenaei TaxID=1737459 RepID=A0ABV7CF92_9GAMM
MSEINLTAAFIMGLFGSGHCIVMCGGIASSLQLAGRDKNALLLALCYNFGRLASYALAGALVASFGAAFASRNNVLALSLGALSGLFIILLGLYVMRVGATLQWFERIGKSLIWQHIVGLNRYLLPINSYPKALAYGALWGWLPCGLVYSALIWTLSAPNAAYGAALMVAFALGTFPLMLLSAQLANKVAHFINNLTVRLILGNVFIWYGVYLLIIATNKLVHYSN